MATYPPSMPYGDQNSNMGFQPGGYPNPYPNAGGGSGGAPPPPGVNVSTTPTAPSLDDIHKVEGYEHLTFKEEIIAPPVAPVWQDEPPSRQDISGIPSLTEEEVRDAALQYASDHCCYGKGVARDMEIHEIRMSSAFHYTLETFGEKRESAWCFEPYEGQVIDGPMNGPAPGPWEVVVYPKDNFVDGKTKVEVPHTAFVKPCHECVGIGRVRCSSCMGSGQKACTWCHGSGRRNDESCSSCNSTGHTRCFTCDATGQVKCKTCNGKGSLKGFVQLTITWANHYDDYISDTSDLPKDKIRKVSGDIVFEEENPRVWPIIHSGDINVNESSRDLVQKHSQQFTSERILKQRHRLRVIPIAEADYQWKSKSGKFYVYGFENKVYFEKYPQNCCWCCVIL